MHVPDVKFSRLALHIPSDLFFSFFSILLELEYLRTLSFPEMFIMASLRLLRALARLAKPTLDFRPSTFRHATVAGRSANIQLRQSLLLNRQFFVGFGIAAVFEAGAWICRPISVKSTPFASMQDERLHNIAQRFADELLKLGCDAILESDYAIEHRIIAHPTRTGSLEIRLQVNRVRD